MASARECQLHYYLGMAYLIDGDDRRAQVSFEACIATHAMETAEFDFATAELLRLAEVER